jgi:hypothetical protein
VFATGDFEKRSRVLYLVLGTVGSYSNEGPTADCGVVEGRGGQLVRTEVCCKTTRRADTTPVLHCKYAAWGFGRLVPW